MDKKNHLLKSLLGIAGLSVLVSCGGGNESEKKEEMKDTAVAITDTLKPDVTEEDITYTLPSPTQIATIFKKSGLKFYNGITNPTDNGSKYNGLNTTMKALNLGVYSADLSYCLLNKQEQYGKNYFKICRQLGSNLGLASAFESNNIMTRLEKNMKNEDSLTEILAEIQMQSDLLLEEGDRGHISVLSFAGAWVESMYIGIQVQIKDKNPDIASKLVEQMTIAENLVKALRVHSSKEPDMKAVLDDISSLNQIYNNFKSIKELKATDPDVIDPSKVSVSMEELAAFTKKVDEIRSRFIKV